MHQHSPHICVITQTHAANPLTKWLAVNTHKVATLPRGTPALQHVQAHANGDLRPTQSPSAITVWATGDYRADAAHKINSSNFWEDPYRKIPLLEGPWWSVFHSHDQAAPYINAEGVVAVCDGSFTRGEPNRAGAGATFRAGTRQRAGHVRENQVRPELLGTRDPRCNHGARCNTQTEALPSSQIPTH